MRSLIIVPHPRSQQHRPARSASGPHHEGGQAVQLTLYYITYSLFPLLSNCHNHYVLYVLLLHVASFLKKLFICPCLTCVRVLTSTLKQSTCSVLSEFNLLNVVNGDLVSGYTRVMALVCHARVPSQDGGRGLKVAPPLYRTCACSWSPHAVSRCVSSQQLFSLFFSFLCVFLFYFY